MDKEVDLSRFSIRTDLAIDYIDEKSNLKGIKYKRDIINRILWINFTLTKENNIFIIYWLNFELFWERIWIDY